jgi:hypothetical protein
LQYKRLRLARYDENKGRTCRMSEFARDKSLADANVQRLRRTAARKIAALVD